MRMDHAKLRAWWWHRQGLDGRLQGKSAAEVLAETGWVRSVGGANPYLTLFARAGIGREAADRAVASLAIHELPGARGCTYVLPACDFALGLAAGRGAASGDIKIALKLGATTAELDKLCGAVVKALAKGPLDTEELRQAVGGAIRNFGPEGTKKGVTTSLPIALGILQEEGEIRRVPVNGRLDQQRYRYALWRPNPLAQFRLSPEEVNTELARRFFHWAGPATLVEFQAFSGLGVKASKAALEPLQLTGAEHLLLPEDCEAFESFRPPAKPQYALLGSIDAIRILHNTKDLLAPADVAKDEGNNETTGHIMVDRGRLVGYWAYDTTTESIAWMSFMPASPALKASVKQMEEFIRSDLGDARGFSLDSPKSRAPRIEALRKAAGTS